MSEALNPLREEGEFSQDKFVDEIKGELGSIATRKAYLLGLLENYEPEQIEEAQL